MPNPSIDVKFATGSFGRLRLRRLIAHRGVVRLQALRQPVGDPSVVYDFHSCRAFVATLSPMAYWLGYGDLAHSPLIRGVVDFVGPLRACRQNFKLRAGR